MRRKPCCNARYLHRREGERSTVPRTQTQVDAPARLGEVALNDRESEAAMNQATVSDERDHLRRSPLKSTPVFVHHGSALREMNISGNQVLVALAIAFCLAGPILWAFVRYWLFAL